MLDNFGVGSWMDKMKAGALIIIICNCYENSLEQK